MKVTAKNKLPVLGKDKKLSILGDERIYDILKIYSKTFFYDESIFFNCIDTNKIGMFIADWSSCTKEIRDFIKGKLNTQTVFLIFTKDDAPPEPEGNVINYVETVFGIEIDHFLVPIGKLSLFSYYKHEITEKIFSDSMKELAVSGRVRSLCLKT